MITNPCTSDRAKAARLVTPVFGLLMGVVMLAILGIHGDWPSGLMALGVMATYSAVLLGLGRRVEAVGLLGGDVPDERGREISTRAVAFAGHVLIVVTVAMFLYELARGRDGSPWAQLAAVGGLAFIGATIWYSRRS
jgi:hypothetical protein